MKKGIKLEYYVVFSLVMVILFTIGMAILFCLYQSIPDTLVTCYFAVFGGEVLSCALIKIFKLRGNNDEN